MAPANLGLRRPVAVLLQLVTRSSTLAALGAGLVSAAIGAWTAYLLLVIEDGLGIKALGWDRVDGVLWLSLTAAALGLIMVMAFRKARIPWAGLSVGGFGAGLFLLSAYVYLSVGNLVDVGAIPEMNASNGELSLPLVGLLSMTFGCVLGLISLKRHRRS